MKRVASGIWFCNHCKLKFAAAAYSTRMRSFKREEAKAQTEAFEAEDAAVMEEEEVLAEPKTIEEAIPDAAPATKEAPEASDEGEPPIAEDEAEEPEPAEEE